MGLLLQPPIQFRDQDAEQLGVVAHKGLVEIGVMEDQAISVRAKAHATAEVTFIVGFGVFRPRQFDRQRRQRRGCAPGDPLNRSQTIPVKRPNLCDIFLDNDR